MKVLWFVSSLEQKGGGERFVLESINALRAEGHEANIVCDRLDAAASFDGRYDLSSIRCVNRKLDHNAGYFSRSFSKLRGTLDLLVIIRQYRPDLVLCQSEFDAIKLYLLSKLLNFRYRVFFFGQMYQFKTDITRYSSVFRRHLETIISSRPGYRHTVIMPPPRLPLAVWLINELVSRLKYRALRAADRVFAVSRQGQWEVSIVYGRDATVCRAAFDAGYIDKKTISNPRPVTQPMRLLSVSRLVDKKRIDLMIAAFSASRISAQLIIIGTGPEEVRLKALASQSVKPNNIHFLGAVDDQQLQDELSRADCLISLDIGDYDISVIEAMGKGLRVLVASDFDTSDFQGEFGGLVSVEPDVAALTAAIDAIPEMPAPNRSNLATLQNHTWQSLAHTCVAEGTSPEA
jgi:glycosyltransferase involved in cell wall biosynthesis